MNTRLAKLNNAANGWLDNQYSDMRFFILYVLWMISSFAFAIGVDRKIHWLWGVGLLAMMALGASRSKSALVVTALTGGFFF